MEPINYNINDLFKKNGMNSTNNCRCSRDFVCIIFPFFTALTAFHPPCWVDESDTEVAVKDNLMERGSVKGSQFQEPLIEFSTLAVRNRLGV